MNYCTEFWGYSNTRRSDFGPRSGPENSAKAPQGISEGGETQSVSAVRQKAAKKLSTFLAVSIIPIQVLEPA